MRIEQRIAFAFGVPPITRPWIFGRMFDEPSANRIEFDVALAREEVSFFLGQTRAEAAFPERTGTPISSIDVLDVALPQRFHQGANTVSRCRRNKQMHVVRHQHESMNPTAGLDGILLEPVEVQAVVLVRKKAGLPIVAPLNEVHGNGAKRQAGAPRHGFFLHCCQQVYSTSEPWSVPYFPTASEPWSVPYFPISHVAARSA
jgi:hypothetical protein